MRLPDFSDTMQRPTPEMNADERGRLLLRYVSARRSLQGLDFRTASLRSAALQGAQLAGVGLVDANLFSADLRGATLSGALLERANLDRARLVEADLRNAQISNAQLGSAQLMGADLRFADLSRSRLQYANLQQAVLQQATLCGTVLQRARLRQADLRGADLRGADLRWADLLGADVSGAHIDTAGIRRSGWSDGDLRDLQARGLVVSDEPPSRTVAPAPAPAPAIAAPSEGLLLRFSDDLSATDVALLGLAVAASGRAVQLDVQQRPLLVTGADPDDLEAIAIGLVEGRWASLGLAPLLTAAALERLAAVVAARAELSLWIQKSDGLRPVLRW